MQQLYPFISSINKYTKKGGEIQFLFCKRKPNIRVRKNYCFTYAYKCTIYF